MELQKALKRGASTLPAWRRCTGRCGAERLNGRLYGTEQGSQQAYRDHRHEEAAYRWRPYFAGRTQAPGSPDRPRRGECPQARHAGVSAAFLSKLKARGSWMVDSGWSARSEERRVG